MPNDLNNAAAVFDNCGITNNVSALAGYLALRMSQIMGVFGAGTDFNDKDCATFGKMDAFNLYLTLGSMGKTVIEEILKGINAGEAGSFENLMLSIAKCDKFEPGKRVGVSEPPNSPIQRKRRTVRKRTARIVFPRRISMCP